MIDFAEEEEGAAGAPAWMATFADLMSLLMCFFVLLLSFSEMDVQKYKLVAGSMKNAFGIQTEVIAQENPSGVAPEITENIEQESPTQSSGALERDDTLEQLQELVEETEQDLQKLEENLQAEVEDGLIELESGFRSITIRIKEKGSFDSGSASLQEEFIPVVSKLRDILADVEGKISIEGHTDNVDISTDLFASNWELSAARSMSVGHELLRDDWLDESRFVISGYADTVPYADNDTLEGRSSNRRVEIVIRQPISDEMGDKIQALDESDPEIQELLNGGVIETEISQ